MCYYPIMLNINISEESKNLEENLTNALLQH